MGWGESIMQKVCVCTHALILATQLQITLQTRTVSLIMRILHWLLWRVEINESLLRMQHQVQTRLLLQLWGSTFNSLLRVLGRVYGFWVPCSGPERALKPSPGFCVVDLSLRVEPRWMLGPRVSIMGRSLLSLQMVLRNQRPVLTPWNQLLQLLPFLGKWFCRTQMTWWMIPPPSPYLIKA